MKIAITQMTSGTNGRAMLDRAAALTFFALLSLFPALLVMVALHIAQQLDGIGHQLSQLRRESGRGTSIR